MLDHDKVERSINTAEKQHQMTTAPPHHITGKTVILASVAGAIIGGPLIALMGFSFVATMTILLVTSPLFILFSPLLFGAAFLFTLEMLGFAAAGAMAVAGVSMVARVAR
ncbi:hypothetical protein BUALT_Bualt18G0078600 [Buddleja alternifolia]|uniref:Oleosin n=1 Tax=Buddleja alternifolia TaxID=168488 RepID=A0AAV6WDT1_9LAMI|nr:hypothetical protein BUALT_Bualt18G0078600 [Buddleja alternifolia]